MIKLKKKLNSLGPKFRLYLRVFFMFLIILLVFSIAQNIQKVLSSKDKIIEAQKRVDTLKRENLDLRKQSEETKRAEYVEREARNKLGLVYDGEIVAILPDRETLKLLAPPEIKEAEFLPPPNWKKWIELFF